MYFWLSVSRETTVSVMTITWHCVPDFERFFFSASPLFWIRCKLLHFVTSNDVMSPVNRTVNQQFNPFPYSFFSDRNKWQIISLPARLYVVVRTRFLKHRSSETFLFCCVGYIVDYEIIQNAIGRLKAKLNENRGFIILKEKKTVEVIYCSMK